MAVSQLLAYLAEASDPQQFLHHHPEFPVDSMSEVMRFASEKLIKIRDNF